jgi:hypothetical protein
MKHILAWAFLFMVGPSSVLAAEQTASPTRVEQLLPADACLYLRYDGYEPHRKAYDRTALGQAMKGDLGEFLEYLTVVLTDALASGLKDWNPHGMQKLPASRAKLLNYLWRHGLAVAAEIRPVPAGETKVLLPDLQARVRLTVVFPNGAMPAQRLLFLPLLDALLSTEGNPVTRRQVSQRIIHEWIKDGFRIAWWAEDRHLVLVFGNDDLEPAVDVAQGRRPNLESSGLFQKITSFREYETDLRGFVQFGALIEALAAPSPNDKLLARLVHQFLTRLFLQQSGVTGFRDLTFHLGFERQYQRSSLIVRVTPPPQRAGLLRLVFAPVEFDQAKLPPLPPDVASVRVSRVDWNRFYRVVNHLVRLADLANLINGYPALKDQLPAVNLKTDVPREILAHLDSTLVLYQSMSEGPSLLGQVMGVKVKDEQKLALGLHKLAQELTNAGGGGEVRKVSYRGVDLSILSLTTGVPVAPTYTIHQGWLVIGVFPQPVKGFILRTEGKHKAWEPPALVAEALDQARKKARPGSRLAAVTVTDPRPATTVGLALLPLVARAIAAGGFSFDVSKVPNAQAITDWQFPGVTVFYDDGDALRWESHSSIDVPELWKLYLLAVPFGFLSL